MPPLGRTVAARCSGPCPTPSLWARCSIDLIHLSAVAACVICCHCLVAGCSAMLRVTCIHRLGKAGRPQRDGMHAGKYKRSDRGVGGQFASRGMQVVERLIAFRGPYQILRIVRDARAAQFFVRDLPFLHSLQLLGQ